MAFARTGFGATAFELAYADWLIGCRSSGRGPSLTASHFRTTMSALLGSKRHRADLRLAVFDVPILAGVDLRSWPWSERRERLGLFA